jgi:hypothetical protein
VDLKAEWWAWRLRAFPHDVSGLEVDGIDVTSLDTFTAGCLEVYFNRGQLDPERMVVLEACVRDLHRVLPSLDRDAAEYFAGLAELCRRVLQQLSR